MFYLWSKMKRSDIIAVLMWTFRHVSGHDVAALDAKLSSNLKRIEATRAQVSSLNVIIVWQSLNLIIFSSFLQIVDTSKKMWKENFDNMQAESKWAMACICVCFQFQFLYLVVHNCVCMWLQWTFSDVNILCLTFIQTSWWCCGKEQQQQAPWKKEHDRKQQFLRKS